MYFFMSAQHVEAGYPHPKKQNAAPANPESGN